MAGMVINTFQRSVSATHRKKLGLSSILGRATCGSSTIKYPQKVRCATILGSLLQHRRLINWLKLNLAQALLRGILLLTTSEWGPIATVKTFLAMIWLSQTKSSAWLSKSTDLKAFNSRPSLALVILLLLRRMQLQSLIISWLRNHFL